MLSNDIPNGLSCIPKDSVEDIIDSVLANNNVNEVVLLLLILLMIILIHMNILQ